MRSSLAAQIDRMTDIYREIPPERVAARVEELHRGITRFLGEA